MKYFLFACMCFLQLCLPAQGPAAYVNPFIGTGGHGHTFPGAAMPFGMVQLSPDTRIDDSWDGCGGYHYSDSLIYGFSHTHLNGTGCSDYGDIALLPFTSYRFGEDKSKSFDYKKYAQRFSHADEQASAGYYSVKLANGVTAELTATTRVGVHQYTFPAGSDARLVVQLEHRDLTIESGLELVDNKTIKGFRRSKAWAKDQYIYFVMEFSEPFTAELSAVVKTHEGLQDFLYQTLYFGKMSANPLTVRTGISNVSTEGAMKNLQAEAAQGDFSAYRHSAEAAWNKELSKIDVFGKSDTERRIFYTALYHTMLQPCTAMDVDSLYRGRDNKVHKAQGFTYYTVFSLWDTFRAAHPLYTIIDQKRTADFINTFIMQYEQGRRLPMWELSSNETDCMIGYHSVSVITDAYMKHIGGFDIQRAYPAMVAAASYTQMGIPQFNRQNFLQVDDESESVSKTLEYAYDDWCIAQVANALDNKADYARLMAHAQAYKNVFDPQTGFMRPRKNGNWLSPFDAKEVNNHYTEANAWQYTFFVPQDVDGLIKLMGGDQAFEAKLDELFTTSATTTGRDQADITGLIGQYAHGNEPSHHMAYLYHYAGKPYKSQQKVDKILADFYKDSPDGLIGNEDCGQMSAWYVMSAMGLYPVCPGSPEYVLGKPLFDSVTVHLENGMTCRIRKNGNGAYVSSVSLNGRRVMRSALGHAELMKGMVLAFNTTASPDSAQAFGKAYLLRPSHKTTTAGILPAAIIQTSARVFKDSLMVSIQCPMPGMDVRYALASPDTAAPVYKVYTKSFYIRGNDVVYATYSSGKTHSDTVSSTLFKMPHPAWKLELHSTYNKQYTAGGTEGLIDGIRGSVNWRKGDWQGYQGQDFECIIDLGKVQAVNACMANFLQDSRAWIMFPTKVEFYISSDGKKYQLMSGLVNTVKPEDEKVQLQEFVKQDTKPFTGRYVKVKAYRFGKLPAWHQGAGGEAFIFIDEVEIR